MVDSPAPSPADFIVVLVTMPDQDTAARVGRTIVEERLAACVNVIPGLRSIYEYGGKLCDEAEVLCLFKARRSSYPELRDRLTALHPYDVPEIIALPLAEGNAAYLAWVLAATSGPAGSAGAEGP